AGNVSGNRLGIVAEESRYFAQVLAVGAFVFAQPILDVFGDAPETLLGAAVSRTEIVAFVAAWVVGPAVVIWGASVCTRLLGGRARSFVHSVVIGALAGVFVVQVLVRSTDLARETILVVATLTATLAAVAQRRLAAMGLFLTYAIVAPLLFVGLFFFASPSGDLVRSSGAASVETTDATAPVLFVVFDELPTASLLDESGAIDASLFPNFAALAEGSTWYRNHTTVATTTRVAVPAIMTGRRPDADRVPVATSYPESIFTLLGGTYTMHVQEPISAVCPTDLCARAGGGGLRALLERSRDVWFDRFDRAPDDGAAVAAPFDIDESVLTTKRLDLAREFVADVATEPGPRLDFAHVLLPHQAWELLPSGRAYDAHYDGTVFTLWQDDDAVAIAKARHILQLQLTDQLLGEMLERLRSLGTYDDALVVVTADHGVSFRTAHPLRAMVPETRGDIAYTPLFVKAPGQTVGRIDERNAEAIDILPTIADLLGTELPWDVDGVSLAGDDLRPGSEKRVFLHDLDDVEADRDGSAVLDASTWYAALLEEAPAVARPVGPDDPLRVFRHGAHGALVGRDVASFTVGPPSELAARLHDRAPDYDPDAGRAPVYVRGFVDTTGIHPIALAVNGRVAAWSNTHENTSDPNVWFLVPESLLRVGRNELVLYEIDGSGGSVVLRPIS
ncbi:MAG TPA: sulfatase-like hydrolase/transferase, partial [Acidimicrobiia bacterium]|nr:sulfatase-like hydrolase/transferase [Acidimicrobiia bacterium]